VQERFVTATSEHRALSCDKSTAACDISGNDPSSHDQMFLQQFSYHRRRSFDVFRTGEIEHHAL